LGCQERVREAIKSLKEGGPVMIYDSGSREAEVDLVFYAEKVDSDVIYTLRTVAGGLICYATLEEVTKALNIPYGDDLLKLLGEDFKRMASRRLSYGDRPAFTIWVNYINVKTGIRDEDRAETIRQLHDVTVLVRSGRLEEARRKFFEEFQAPGHVPILAARSLKVRRGHTELSTHLAMLAGLEPSVVFAEMLTRGGVLGLDEAEALSRRRGWPLVTGDDIVRAWENGRVHRSN
jgi:3,4-dihydroxy 2-butanone 4-phosphate synthase